MTPERLKEIAERAEKATPGTWTWFNGCSWWRLGVTDSVGIHDAAVLKPYVARDGWPDISAKQADRDFIAHARTDIPDLLRYITHLEKYKQHLPKCQKWQMTMSKLNPFMLDDSKPCTCGLEGANGSI